MIPAEHRAFTRLVDGLVCPGGSLPPAAQTDAAAAFERLLAAAPWLNRTVLRAAVLLHRGRPPQILARLAAHCYYGDARVSRALGYDPAARMSRAVERRAR